MRATRKQIWKINQLAEEKGVSKANLLRLAQSVPANKVKAAPNNWQFTREAASQLIDKLVEMSKEEGNG